MVSKLELPDDGKILTLFKASAVFDCLADDVLRELIGSCQGVAITKGATLFQQGDSSNAIYLVLQGSFSTHAIGKDGEPYCLGEKSVGDVIGEMEVLTGEQRCETMVANDDSQLIVLSRTSFEALVGRHAEVLQQIGQNVLRRLRRKHMMEVLPKLLGEVSTSGWQAIEENSRWVHLPGRQALFREGDDGQGIWVLMSGHLRAVAKNLRGEQEVVGDISVGEPVGEMAFFSERPQSKTVFATRDSDLLHFPAKGIELLVRDYPHAMIPICRTLVDRFERILGKQLMKNQMAHVAVIPASPSVPVHEFCRELSQAMNRIAPSLHLSASYVDGALGFPGAAQMSNDEPNYIRYCAWRDEHQDEYDYVLYEAEASVSNWSERCVRQADQIIVLADATADPQPGEVEQSLVGRQDDLLHIHESLVLMHPESCEFPHGTQDWLDARSVDRHHHLRWGRQKDMDRLARFLMGRAVGVVLGSGGARGFAHVGALRALREAGIPIDYIGGSSVGALIAACQGLGWSEGQLINNIKRLFEGCFDYTIPIVSLTTGHAGNELLQEVFDDIQIADLWLPYFAVSSNLSRAEVMVHRKGRLWRAVRASLCVPGVFPPVVHNGDLLVDGALLNSLPIGVMHRFLGGGTVVAVDVSQKVEMIENSPYGDEVSGWQVLWSRINPFSDTIDVPTLPSLMYRVGELGSIQNQLRRMRNEKADVLISPDVQDCETFDIEQAERLIEAGYRATKEALCQNPEGLRFWLE